MTTTDEILRQVMDERVSQDRKFGTQSHSASMWLAILTEEVGEAAEQVVELASAIRVDDIAASLRDELIQVAAVAVAFVEWMDNGVAHVTFTEEAADA